MAVSWCLFCRREYKVIVSVSSVLKVSFCKGYIIWHVPSFNWLLLCNSPNPISCYYCMKEKSELTMCFVTHSRTISLHVPLGTIHDTVFNLACFQHKKHSVSSAKPPVHPLHTRTLIYAMFCLVRKLVLSYRASPSPFLSGRSFPRCAFFFKLRQAWVPSVVCFCAEADRRARLFLGTQWSSIPHTYFCTNFIHIDSHLSYQYLLICIYLWIIITYY